MMEEGDRQRGVTFECSAGESIEKQKENKRREGSERKEDLWKRGKQCHKRMSHKSQERSGEGK